MVSEVHKIYRTFNMVELKADHTEYSSDITLSCKTALDCCLVVNAALFVHFVIVWSSQQ